MNNLFNHRPEGWGTKVEAPKLSKAKAAAAAQALAQENPNRARIEAKQAEILAKLQSK
jgi:hypothetical protein